MQAVSKLILVKHSLPDIKPDIPAKRWRLSEEGRVRCNLLADRLALHAPDIIVSSVEPKARETGQIVAKRLQLPFEVTKDLHEHDRTNVPFFEDKKAFQASVETFFAKPQELVFGAETAAKAYARFSKAVIGTMMRHVGKNLVITTHGTVLTLFVSRVSNKNPFELWKQLGLPAFVVLSLPEFIVLDMEPEVAHNNQPE